MRMLACNCRRFLVCVARQASDAEHTSATAPTEPDDDAGPTTALPPFPRITRAAIEALRYRAEDVARSLTKNVVREVHRHIPSNPVIVYPPYCGPCSGSCGLRGRHTCCRARRYGRDCTQTLCGFGRTPDCQPWYRTDLGVVSVIPSSDPDLHADRVPSRTLHPEADPYPSRHAQRSCGWSCSTASGWRRTSRRTRGTWRCCSTTSRWRGRPARAT